MDWGIKNRLSRIIKPETGHTVMLAVDHGYFLGPTTKLENARKTIISPESLKQRRSVMNDMGSNMNVGILPRYQFSIHPNFPILVKWTHS